MNNIVPFVPRASVKYQQALNTLVRHYRDFLVEPLDNPFNPRSEPWTWKNFRWIGLGRFMKYEFSFELGRTAKNLPPNMALPEKTMEEIQALILHHLVLTQGVSDTTLVTLLRALLSIESILRKRSITGIANFTDLKASDLNNASLLSIELNQNNNPSSIEPGRNALIKAGVVSSGSIKTWVDSAFRAQQREYDKNTRCVDRKKLPHIRAVTLCADYFANQPWLTKKGNSNELDSDQRNIIVSSVLAIICHTPCRLDELIKNLPEECLINQTANIEGQILGINWYADKTDMSHIKWVPYTSARIFEPIIEEAMARLKHVSEGARALLRSWDNQCKEYNEKAFLEAKQDGRLPKGWPWYEPKLNLRYSKAMFVCFRHQMNTVNHTQEDRIHHITYSNFKDWLKTKKCKNRHTGNPSIQKGFFDRIGYEELTFSVDDYNSHAFRHMVNTAARLGGSSEFDVNLWSHRKKHGEVYNHTTGEQRRNLILHGNHKSKELTPEERLDHIRHDVPLTRKNLGMRLELIDNSYGGFTFNHPLGTCIHNYAESPCMRSMDCVMCPENMHCKGNKRDLKNLKDELEQSNTYLEMALKEKDSRAINRFERRSEVLNSLVEVLGDNSPLVEGDLVILSPQQAPKAGLSERARLAAEQIKKSQFEIESKHKNTKAEVGINRSLPRQETKTPNNEYSTTNDIKSVVDELLTDFEDED